MRAVRSANLLLLIISLLLALLLEVAPMPNALQEWRPLWLALVLSYWALETPHNFRIGLAWLTGIAQDVLYGSLLGFHGLFLVFVVFVILLLQQRLRMFPHWQQAFFLTLVFVAGQLVLLWLGELTGTRTKLMEFLLPALISGLLWPWVYMIMHGLHRLFSRK